MKGPGPGKQLEVVDEGADQAMSKERMSGRRSIVVSLRTENRFPGRVITLAWVVQTKVHKTFEGDLLIFPGKNYRGQTQNKCTLTDQEKREPRTTDSRIRPLQQVP
jgi:hypothetical protein